MKYLSSGLLRLLAVPRQEDPDGRDRVDHPEDPLPEDDGRGGKGVREAEAGRAGRFLAAAVDCNDSSPLVQLSVLQSLYNQHKQNFVIAGGQDNTCGRARRLLFSSYNYNSAV